MILFFSLSIVFGFIMGFEIVYETTNFTLSGIEENLLGNEENDDANTLIFKKSPREIRTMIHNHVLSLSALFLLIGFLVKSTSINNKLSSILAIEPFVSIFLTFGGIYIVWLGYPQFSPIIYLSGVLMFLSITSSLILIIRDTLR